MVQPADAVYATKIFQQAFCQKVPTSEGQSIGTNQCYPRSFRPKETRHHTDRDDYVSEFIIFWPNYFTRSKLQHCVPGSPSWEAAQWRQNMGLPGKQGMVSNPVIISAVSTDNAALDTRFVQLYNSIKQTVEAMTLRPRAGLAVQPTVSRLACKTSGDHQQR